MMFSLMKVAMSYYDNLNETLFSLLDTNAQRVCEFGCGGGAMAKAIRAVNPAVYYVGLELMAEPLDRARQFLDVALCRDLNLVGDWSSDAELASALPHLSFDHVIFGDVLEHLLDPEAVVRQAADRLVPGGTLLACIPNVQHWSVFVQLIQGRWPREDSGLFDRTHVRWFTLNDMIDLMSQAGLTVEQVTARTFESTDSIGPDVVDYLEPLAHYLGVDQDQLAQRALPLQYVLQARKPLHVS